MMTVGIVGLGLIGGSAAKALQLAENRTIIGFDKSSDVINSALKIGAIFKGYTDLYATRDCDVVIFATPPNITLNMINSCEYKSGALVCDMCGIKDFVKDIREDIDFVGMHPMAGKETSGFENSDDGLFKSANLLLVKRPSTSKEACDLAVALGEAMGFGVLRWTDMDSHDKLIAFTSQMPHVLSSIIVSHPLYNECHDFEGGSLNDFTRIARLDAPMWASLFISNKDNLNKQIDYYISSLNAFKSMLEDKDELQKYLLLARNNRINHERTDNHHE